MQKRRERERNEKRLWDNGDGERNEKRLGENGDGKADKLKNLWNTSHNGCRQQPACLHEEDIEKYNGRHREARGTSFNLNGMKSLSNLLSYCICTAAFMDSRAVQRGRGRDRGNGETDRGDLWESLHIIFIRRTLNPSKAILPAYHVSCDFTSTDRIKIICIKNFELMFVKSELATISAFSMVKVLCYKPEGRGFETRWGEWTCSLNLDFSTISAFSMVKVLCYKTEGRGFESWWGEWTSSIFLIFPVAECPEVYSASNRNEYQEQNNVKTDNLTAIGEPIV
jgi:hypothetical protein